MSKTTRKTDGKMKRREIRNGTKRQDWVLLIAKERDWGYRSKWKGGSTAYQSITLICTVCRGSHQSHLIILSFFCLFWVLLLCLLLTQREISGDSAWFYVPDCIIDSTYGLMKFSWKVKIQWKRWKRWKKKGKEWEEWELHLPQLRLEWGNGRQSNI